MKKLFLFLMALSLSTSIFADGGIFEAWVIYDVNDEAIAAYKVGDSEQEMVDVNLGTISSFYIDSFFVKVWQADGSYFERVCVSYRIDGGEIQSYDTRWKRDLGTIEREWAVELNKDIAYDLDNGDHTLEVWFWGQLNPGEEERFLSNSGKNYVYKFTKDDPEPKITSWFVIGGFNNWKSGYELTGEDNSKSVKIAVDAKRNYEFKFIRVEENDTTWYGLPIEGNVMKYGECTDWVAYQTVPDENKNAANVGLLTTKSGDYEFTVDVTNTHDGEIAPKFSVEIPEPGPEPEPQSVSNWYVIGTFNGWSNGYELKGEDNALSTNISVDANANYEFKLIREVKQGARIDTIWFGLPSEGNVMKYGACTDWVAFCSRDIRNQANVGLQTTKAGDYTFTVDVTNVSASEIAPKFSVAIPDPKICQLIVKPNDILGGAVTGGGTYEYGTQVTVTASENSGYRFIKWSNGSTYNPYKFTIVDDMELVAFFQRTEADPVNVDEVVVTPDENSANIQWPRVDNAYTYTLIIWADAAQTEKVCTLIFDASGILTSINFNKKPRTSTSQTEQLSGFSYTVTGLEENTEYFYSLAAKDEHDNLIGEEEKGNFTTKGTATGVEEAIDPSNSQTLKLIKHGNLYILRDGEMYNAQGARVE